MHAGDVWAVRELAKQLDFLGERLPLVGVVELVLLEYTRLAVVARLPHLVPRVLVAQPHLLVVVRQLALDQHPPHLLLAVKPARGTDAQQRLPCEQLREVRGRDAC